MPELLDLPAWPYVLVLTDEERTELERSGSVTIAMFEFDRDLLDIYFWE